MMSTKCARDIPLTISTTKSLNTCWLQNLIWWRIQVSKMKSCKGSCSQRACTAYRSRMKSCNLSCSQRACAVFGSGMKSCNGSCSQRACAAYRSVFSLFELISQKNVLGCFGPYRNPIAIPLAISSTEWVGLTLVEASILWRKWGRGMPFCSKQWV